MGRSEARREIVKDLRKYAESCGVELVRDIASRKDVNKMMDAIRASSKYMSLKDDVDGKFNEYEQTFSKATDEEAGPEAQAEAERASLVSSNERRREFRLRGTSFLFTYNWDFLGREFPDETAAPADASALWHLWRAWKKAKKKELGVVRSTHTLEESLESALPGRVHFHWKVDLAEAIDHRTTCAFAFHGVRPDARTTFGTDAEHGARGANQRAASNRGHFYVWAPKIGTLSVGTNWHPFADYRVNGRWAEDLWGDHKLDHDTYEGLSLRIRRGHATRKRDLDLVRSEEKAARVDQRIAEVDAALNQKKAPFRVFEKVTAWEDSFLNLDFRWKILVLCADSASGKSTYAESLFDRPYVITVEDASHLDLKEFDGEKFDGIVLDNVNSWDQIRSWRAILQARNAKSKGGQSGTNMYAYTQYLFGVAIVATVDLDAPDAFLVDDQNPEHSKWLVKNCVIVHLPAGETYYQKVEPVNVPNKFSLFAETVKRRRTGNGEQTSSSALGSGTHQFSNPERRGAARLVPEEDEEEDPFGFGVFE